MNAKNLWYRLRYQLPGPAYVYEQEKKYLILLVWILV